MQNSVSLKIESAGGKNKGILFALSDNDNITLGNVSKAGRFNKCEPGITENNEEKQILGWLGDGRLNSK